MIPITDEFDDLLGQFGNYDPNDVTLFETVRGLQHTDIRAISPDSVLINRNMFRLIESMTTLDTFTMEDMESIDTFIEGETWVHTGSGTQTFTPGSLVMTVDSTASISTSDTLPFVDLSTYSSGVISIASPSFPISEIDMVHSKVIFTKEDDTVKELTLDHGLIISIADADNLVSNPSFETNTSGWSVSSATLTRVTQSDFGSDSGTHCGRMTGTDNGVASTTTRTPISSGQTVALKGKICVRSDTSFFGSNVALKVMCYNSSNVLIGSINAPTANIEADIGTIYSLSGLVPYSSLTSGTAKVAIGVSMADFGGNFVLDFDVIGYKLISILDAEFNWEVSILGDTPIIKEVGFSLIQTPSVGHLSTVTIKAIRAFLNPSNWIPFQIDINTRLQRLQPTVDLIGLPATDNFPQVWRSDDIPGSNDPRPFNTKLALNFFSGDNTSTEVSTFTMFMRGRREDFLTQLDLDGLDDGTIISKPSIGENQYSLELSDRQPDYGLAVYNSREQQDLDQLTQAGMEILQSELERISDTISESWLSVKLEMKSGSDSKVTVSTTESANAYEFTHITIDDNTRYILLIDLEDTTLRVRICPITSSGQIDYNGIILDSDIINNDFILLRRKGRVGWEMDITTPNSWVDSFRSRGAMFGEFITNSYKSLTPVSGAQIFAGTTGDIILTNGLIPLGDPTMEIDTHNSQSSDGSLKLTTIQGDGIQSDVVNIDDFANTEIVFDLYFPTTLLSSGQYLNAGLIGLQGLMVFLILPQVGGDQWQNIRIPLRRASNEQTGNYQFFLASQGSATWWIDNLQILQHTISWSGRSIEEDAWNRFGGNWIDFNNLVNNKTSGALFPDRGTSLQIRGQTLTSEAHIDKVYTKPKYSELGRLVWDVGRKYR